MIRKSETRLIGFRFSLKIMLKKMGLDKPPEVHFSPKARPQVVKAARWIAKVSTTKDTCQVFVAGEIAVDSSSEEAAMIFFFFAISLNTQGISSIKSH